MKMKVDTRIKTGLPNILTSTRIVLSIAIMFTKEYSLAFLACYIIAGLTDVLDGFAARRLNLCSDFGARLDTVADIIFVLAATYKILPQIEIPIEILIWIGIIAIIKFVNITCGLLKHKKLLSVHNTLNRVTGILLFVFPLTLNVINVKYSSVVICMIATLAALLEAQDVANNK